MGLGPAAALVVLDAGSRWSKHHNQRERSGRLCQLQASVVPADDSAQEQQTRAVEQSLRSELQSQVSLSATLLGLLNAASASRGPAEGSNTM